MHWNPNYSVNLNEIDAQHWHFFTLLDAIEIAIKSKDAESVHALLEELRRHAYAHFKSEEAYMEAYEYPGERHREEHRKMSERLETMLVDPELRAASVLVFLYKWLVAHIQLEDAQLAAHVAAKRSAVLPAAQDLGPETRRDPQS